MRAVTWLTEVVGAIVRTRRTAEGCDETPDAALGGLGGRADHRTGDFGGASESGGNVDGIETLRATSRVRIGLHVKEFSHGNHLYRGDDDEDDDFDHGRSNRASRVALDRELVSLRARS